MSKSLKPSYLKKWMIILMHERRTGGEGDEEKGIVNEATRLRELRGEEGKYMKEGWRLGGGVSGSPE